MTRFAASQCSMEWQSRYCDSCWTTRAISGRVAMARYIKQPIRERYGSAARRRFSSGDSWFTASRDKQIRGSMGIFTGYDSAIPNWTMMRLISAVWERATARVSRLRSTAIPMQHLTAPRSAIFYFMRRSALNCSFSAALVPSEMKSSTCTLVMMMPVSVLQ